MHNAITALCNHPSRTTRAPPTLQLPDKSKSRQVGKLASWQTPPPSPAPPTRAGCPSFLSSPAGKPTPPTPAPCARPRRSCCSTCERTTSSGGTHPAVSRPRRPTYCTLHPCCARTHSTTRTVPVAHLPVLTAPCNHCKLLSPCTPTLTPPARIVHTSSHPALAPAPCTHHTLYSPPDLTPHPPRAAPAALARTTRAPPSLQVSKSPSSQQANKPTSWQASAVQRGGAPERIVVSSSHPRLSVFSPPERTPAAPAPRRSPPLPRLTPGVNQETTHPH